MALKNPVLILAGIVAAIAVAAFPAVSQTSMVRKVDVPMTFWGTRPTVAVTVNGRGPYNFLIDTGAGGPAARADASLVKTLGIAVTGQAQTSDSGLAAVPIGEVTLGSVQLGSMVSHDVPALTRSYNSGASYLRPIDGILGLNFFSQVLLTLDFPNARVRVGSGQLPRANGLDVLDYEVIDGNIYIPVMIGGRAMKAELDTGNLRFIDLPSSWLRDMRLASFPRRAGNSSGASGSNEIREVVLASPVVIGRHRVERPVVTFMDDFAEANIGSAILSEFIITIDQKNHRVQLLKS